ncbi:atypical chemokine receptor 1 [Nycticebus coucang]|uniref:atypical chemokine receptor 1 n=1 Tax=Nycticebus coucang TaxID=9470 RepID=UPI00234C0BD4|nr:atypical chemokine receptor 1 [Nycticebus coucang]
MGNCLHQVEPSLLSGENLSQQAFGDIFWNYSDYETGNISDYDSSSLEAAAPCHSCNLLDSSSLPFFILASILGILASTAVLFALFRPLFHWQLCPGRPILAQLAVGSALFSIVVPILGPGLSSAPSTTLCRLGYYVWYGSAFAQALLIGCRACLGPKLAQVPGLTLGLTVGLWVAATLLALPITLASGTSHGICTMLSSRDLKVLHFIHTAVCLVIFVLLPLGLLGAKVLMKVPSRGAGPWVDVLWAWFIFWWPHGVLLGVDSLVRFRLWTLPNCVAQRVLDLLLDLAEALGILHCVAAPLLLALFCHQATRTFLPSLPLPERWSPPNTLEEKS